MYNFESQNQLIQSSSCVSNWLFDMSYKHATSTCVACILLYWGKITRRKVVKKVVDDDFFQLSDDMP